MSYGREEAYDMFAVDAAVTERAAFMRRTYLHLFAAVLAFIGLEVIILNVPAVLNALMIPLRGQFGVLLYILGFMAASWVARTWAYQSASPTMQYVGLSLYTLVEAVFFAPILWFAHNHVGPDVIPTAAIMTLTAFGGLTVIVLMTGANFSFLRVGLMLAMWIALAAVVAGMIFGFHLGLGFSVAMVVVACGFILYDTSNVLHHYRTDQHVGAALELFASLALLFYYVLRIVIALQSRD